MLSSLIINFIVDLGLFRCSSLDYRATLMLGLCSRAVTDPPFLSIGFRALLAHEPKLVNPDTRLPGEFESKSAHEMLCSTVMNITVRFVTLPSGITIYLGITQIIHCMFQLYVHIYHRMVQWRGPVLSPAITSQSMHSGCKTSCL